jgi:stage II sporulation protein R
MKKTLILLTLIIIILCSLKNDKVIIPKESIRFRVVANSNTKEDQYIKKEIVKDLQQEITNLNIIPKSVEINRNVIQKNIPRYQTIINNTFKRLNIDTNYTINYGMNYFPRKEYKDVIYEEGEYESLVVEIGDAKGDNFWCVLFPPLCLLEGEEENKESIKYTSFIKEIIDKYF